MVMRPGKNRMPSGDEYRAKAAEFLALAHAENDQLHADLKARTIVIKKPDAPHVPVA